MTDAPAPKDPRIPAILAAHESFYAAFRERDEAAMTALWARLVPVAVTHPGWQTVLGRKPVLASFQRIMSDPRSPWVWCHDPHVILPGGDVAVVLCTEVIGESRLTATNILVIEDGVWRFVHHQAGPGQGPPAEREEDEPSGLLH